MRLLDLSHAGASTPAWAIAFYLASSAGMSIFNKLAISALPLPWTLTGIQMLFAVAAIGVNWPFVHIGSLRDALRWGCTVPLLFSAMLVSSMIALNHNTLGTVAVCRNVAPLFPLVIESMFRVPMQVTPGTVGALLTIILGVGLYYSQTLALSAVGLAAIGLNLGLAVLERLLQRHLLAQDPVDLSKPALMLLNNAVGVVLNSLALLTVCWHTEVVDYASAFGRIGGGGCALVLLSCANGVAISYAGLQVQQRVTATTFMVLTNVNKLVVVAFGALAIGETLTPVAAAGVLIATGGALW